jgi:hypothetical protein
VVAGQPFNTFQPRPDPANPRVGTAGPDGATPLLFRGTLVRDEQRVEYVETVTVAPPARFTLRFEFLAETALDLRMWRHYFMFPVAHYAGAKVTSGGKTITLPETLNAEQLLDGKDFVVEAVGVKVTVGSSIPLGLIDHRKWGTNDYLLAGYPVSGKVEEGRKWEVEVSVGVEAER